MLELSTGRWLGTGFTYPRSLGTPTGTGLFAPLVGATHTSTVHAGSSLIARPSQAAPRIWSVNEQGVRQETGFADSITPGSGFVISASGKLALAFSSTPDAVALGAWNLPDGQLVAKITAVDRFAALFDGNLMPTVSSDDRLLAVPERRTEDAPAGISVFEINGAKFRLKIPGDTKAPFTAARFSRDSARLFTGNGWGNVQVWDVTTGKLLKSRQAHGFHVTGFEFSADGQLYASLAKDGSVQVWDSATDEPIGGPLPHNGAIERAAFSADNRRISTVGTNGMGRIWDIASGLPLTGGAGLGADATAQGIFSPGDRFVMAGPATNGAGTQRIWSAPPSAEGRPTPPWLLQLATLCAGRRLTDEGKLTSAEDEFPRLDGLRREIAELPADDSYAVWARWFLSDRPDRPIAPGFSLTPTDAKKIFDELSAPDPVPGMLQLDDQLLEAGKFAEMEPLERKILAELAERGAGDLEYCGVLIRLAGTLNTLGKFAEAETHARSALAIREKLMSPENYGIASARGTAATALVGQKRYAEAEPMLLSALEAMKALEDASSTGLSLGQYRGMKQRIDSLIELYEATGRPEKAAEWKRWQPKSSGTTAPAAPTTRGNRDTNPSNAAPTPPPVPSPKQ